jgi:hypothetical protein
MKTNLTYAGNVASRPDGYSPSRSFDNSGTVDEPAVPTT